MNIWEDGTKHIIGENAVLALRALGVGYRFIRPIHGAVLLSYGLCYSAPPAGWKITPQGQKCLEIWDAGDDYDSTANDRKGAGAPGPEVEHGA